MSITQTPWGDFEDQPEEGAAYLQPMPVAEGSGSKVKPELITLASKYWDRFRKLPIGNAEMIMHLATFAATHPKETEVERLKENEARHLNAIGEAMRTIEKYTSLNGNTSCGNHVYNDLRQHLAETNNL